MFKVRCPKGIPSGDGQAVYYPRWLNAVHGPFIVNPKFFLPAF